MATPTPEQIANWMAHPEESLKPNIYACSIATAAISIPILVLRVWSRRLAHGRIVLDLSDYMLFVAWIFYIAALVAYSVAAVYGLGKHVIFVTDLRDFIIWGTLLEIFYYFSIGFIKFSILALYRTIFVQKKFRRYVYGMYAIVAAWTLVGVLVSAAQCVPFEYAYDKTIPGGGRCINYGLLVLIAGVINIVTDFVILALPVPMVWGLQVSKQRKLLILVTFALGSSACIVSIVRLAFSLVVSSTADPSWDNVITGYVSATELLVGILAASIPTMRPLYRRFFQGSVGDSGAHSGPSKASNIVSGSHNTQVSIGGSKRHHSVGAGGVYVTDEVELMRHSLRNGKWVRIEEEDDGGSRPFSAEDSRGSSLRRHEIGEAV